MLICFLVDSTTIRLTKKVYKHPINIIIKHIKICGSCNELKNNPMSRIYDFEELKHELNGYCSFRLEKNGTIRLIVKIFEEENCVKIEYISMDHYSDFKRMLKKSKGE